MPFIARSCSSSSGWSSPGWRPRWRPSSGGRAVQGLGAGLNIVSLYVVVGRLYPEAMRPRLFSAISSAWVSRHWSGPSVAGCRGRPAVLALGVPRRAAAGGARGRPHAAQTARPRCAHRVPSGPPPHAAGAGRGRRGRLPAVRRAADGPRSFALLPVGAGLLVAGLPRLLPRGIFRVRRGLPTAVLMRGVLAGAFFGAETFVPLMLVEERGLATAASRCDPHDGRAVSWSVGSWLQGRPGLRTPRTRSLHRGRPWLVPRGGRRLARPLVGSAAGGRRGRLGRRRPRYGPGHVQHQRGGPRRSRRGPSRASTPRRCSVSDALGSGS